MGHEHPFIPSSKEGKYFYLPLFISGKLFYLPLFARGGRGVFLSWWGRRPRNDKFAKLMMRIL
jgi:hypothetical protein